MIRTPNEPGSDISTGLGAPIRPPAPPAPAPAPTGTPGIFRRPDGKLETDLPVAFCGSDIRLMKIAACPEINPAINEILKGISENFGKIIGIDLAKEGADQTAEEDLPYRFYRESSGTLMYRCPRCEREAEYFGPDELDPTWPCGGSMRCLP